MRVQRRKSAKLILGINYLYVGIALLKGEFCQGPDAVDELDGLVDDRQPLLAPSRRHREHVLGIVSLVSVFFVKRWVIRVLTSMRRKMGCGASCFSSYSSNSNMFNMTPLTPLASSR